MRKTKTYALAAVLSLSLFATACGADDEASDAPAPEETAAPTDDVAANLAGPGCADYAEQVPDGDGSVAGMAEAPVTEAASNNPLLTTLTATVTGEFNPDVNLVDTLNGGEFTVFAPVDEAFAALDEETLATLGTPEGAETLESVLTYHVVPGQIQPDDIEGELDTANGATLTVEGSGDSITVGEDQANVICGGVQTRNATVYLIDAVLMPPA